MRVNSKAPLQVRIAHTVPYFVLMMPCPSYIDKGLDYQLKESSALAATTKRQIWNDDSVVTFWVRCSQGLVLRFRVVWVELGIASA